MIRGAAASIGVLLTALLAPAAVAENILSARYDVPTTRYAHGILGDAVEWGALVLKIETCPDYARSTRTSVRITLPEEHVFEDTTPRLADLDLDGDHEVVVVETDIHLGAALAIYDSTGKIAETPHIGRAHRWLAPLGAADLDGDGAVELAYIDRPHLAKTLRIWRFENGTLTPVADLPGLTNHRIGEDHISGGIRICDGPPEIITVNADWSRLIASTLFNGQINTRDIGPHTGPASFTAALSCD
jgi:hypothetical protein